MEENNKDHPVINVGEKIRFRKINIISSEGKITMAYIPTVFEKNKYLVSFSFCSPKDTYSKKRGQYIAKLRLWANPKLDKEGFIKKVSFYIIEKEKDVSMLKTVSNLICEIIKKKKILWAENIKPEDLR